MFGHTLRVGHSFRTIPGQGRLVQAGPSPPLGNRRVRRARSAALWAVRTRLRGRWRLRAYTNRADPYTMPSDTAGERPLRLLVAERFGWFTRTVATVLDAAGWRVVRASTGLRTLQFVEETSPDIVIVRDDLEDTDPVDLCAALRETPEIGLVTPIVVVATDAARSQHVAALRAGAWDYAVQPLDAESFILRIANLARARRQVEQLARAALVDSETGLYNHLGMARRAEEVEADTRPRHAPVSCVVFAPETDVPKNGSRDVTAKVGAILRRRG